MPRTSLGDEGKTNRPQGPRTPWRAPDHAAVEELLKLLARAVQQFHTYPPASSMCSGAIDACRRALVQLESRDQVAFRVTPGELMVDEIPVGNATLIETELARRLHAASIASVTIERAVSPRELSRFCIDLLQSGERSEHRLGLVDRLREHGVDRIVLEAAHRPEVLQVPPPPDPITGLLERERERREALFASGAISHLYPPDRGWVRVDPASPIDTISLTDLALLSESPAALAEMLTRLTDDDVEPGGEALSRKFSDVVTLFAALDPRVARVMFARLARAVLDLEPDRRQTLLRKTILPGLLDGRIDGTILRDFPDLDLAESLCLLLDLETAAPEVVTTALARLDLSPERQAAVVPLLEERLQVRGGSRAADTGLEAHARKLIQIGHEQPRSFSEFAAFDLSLDAYTTEVLGHIKAEIGATDFVVAQLHCVWQLAKLEPNPELVQQFVDRAVPLFQELERCEHWPSLAFWFVRYRDLAASLCDSRPDVADVISSGLTGFCTVDRAWRLAELAARDADSHAAAGAVVDALGPGMGASLLALVQNRGNDPRARAAVQLLCDHAPVVAPALAAVAGRVEPPADRAIARALGFAGPGFETALASQLGSADEQTVREALRSLARIGTPRAATAVVGAIEKAAGWLSTAAEETLWHFTRGEAERQIRHLLGRREFVQRRPAVALRLLERTAQSGLMGLEPVLKSLAPFRYRFWNPHLARLGRKARTLLAT